MNPTQILQRGGGLVLGSVRISQRLARLVIGEAFGLAGRAGSIRRRRKPDMDDVTLARKVETELFRGRSAPKASVDVNVVDGVVWLRGEVRRPQQIRALEAKAQAIPEVRRVENLLHLSKTPAPTRADTPRRQQRTRSSTKRPKPRRSAGGRVTGDRTDAIVSQAEPSPAQHAKDGEGRSPAPLGSQAGEQSETPQTQTVPAEQRESGGNGAATNEGAERAAFVPGPASSESE